jgi:hypothetical protein
MKPVIRLIMVKPPKVAIERIKDISRSLIFLR